MILVFGGTTEGKQAVNVLKTLGLPFIYSTKVKTAIETTTHFEYRFGALTKAKLEVLITDRTIKTIINASHPFALELHKTIAAVAQKTKTVVLRLERTFPERTLHPLVHYVPNYASAITVLNQFQDKRLLALSGVQSIEKLIPYWKKANTHFRILDRDSSIAIAKANNFPESQLILGLPNKTIEEEIAIFKQKNIEIILTKESGESGALSIKINAALTYNIPIIILEKPELPSVFNSIKSETELKEQLVKMYNPLLLKKN
ncbi:precorrin-6A/cobalt-precorrin-6A reductase [uncultured Aquimarina sp.]|uniref:precorrin-6A/cobalt-precorrin-6A reductase n=1 Tax=uncultured Aquimarina sp. TaxID=575652 RepID=UPI00262088D7|nr:precorrin-6A/cobalt-precorrin-6A reductase [uncultured Aquimarina sp.]